MPAVLAICYKFVIRKKMHFINVGLQLRIRRRTTHLSRIVASEQSRWPTGHESNAHTATSLAGYRVTSALPSSQESRTSFEITQNCSHHPQFCDQNKANMGHPTIGPRSVTGRSIEGSWCPWDTLKRLCFLYHSTARKLHNEGPSLPHLKIMWRTAHLISVFPVGDPLRNDPPGP